MKIEVTYQTNYNGCSVHSVDLTEEQAEQIQDVIVDHAFSECDEDGYFEGSTVVLTQYIIDTVRTMTDADAEVVVVFDHVSS